MAKAKNQGVKEFHMLARIGSYCKIMVFSPFKSSGHILSLFQGQHMMEVTSNLQKPLKCTV